MILVTGAAGKTGRAVIRELAAHGESVRALVHRQEQAREVEMAGASEVLAGDMRDRDAVARAASRVRAIYHICPNVSPDEVAIGASVIAGAKAARVGHLVYHSVLHPQSEAMPHHWQKLRVEERLFESGLPYTVLQPAAYMQNLLAYWDQIAEQGVFAVPYDVETRLGMVDLDDVAEAARVVLTEPGHEGATYELAGPDVLSQREIVALAAHRLGRPVRAETLPREAWRARVKSAGLGDYQVEALTRMFAYYEQHGFWGNPHVLGWLLGRRPTSLAEFIERFLSEPAPTLDRTALEEECNR